MGYRLVLFWRWLFLIIQLAAVAGFLFLYGHRSAPTAATDLAAGRQITAVDMRVSLLDPLVGKYLLQDIKTGETITPELLTDRAPARLPGATLAAVVTVAVQEAKRLGVARGVSVDVMRGGSAPPVRGTVMASDCDDKKCLVYVGLEKPPAGQVIDTETFSAATLAVASPPKAK